MSPERRQAIEQRRAELLTVKEFAMLTRVNERTVRRWLRRRRQPGAMRVCGQWRIDIAAACPVLPTRQETAAAAL